MIERIDGHTLSLLISDHRKEINEEVFSALDWVALVRRAQVEGVGPLLYWSLSEAGCFHWVPEGIRKTLRLLYADTGIKNQIYFKELERLCAAFQQAEIELVALKGICLALTVYPAISLRPMGDIDLLAPKAKIVSAVAIAKSLGYREARPEAAPGFRDLLNHEVCLRKTGAQPVILELHHSLVADKTYSYAVPVDWFWEQTEPCVPLSAAYSFENLLMLTPEAQVLYAAAHAMLQHGGDQVPLRWFYDLDRLIRTYQERIDWGLLLAQARTFAWASALDAALTQTVDYFETPLPENVLASLSESADRHRDLVALKQTHPMTNILQERQRLLSLNWYGRLRLVLALLIPTPAYMRWRYRLKNSWLLPFYYPHRWWGIFKDAWRTLLAWVSPGN